MISCDNINFTSVMVHVVIYLPLKFSNNRLLKMHVFCPKNLFSLPNSNEFLMPVTETQCCFFDVCS